MKRLKYYFRLYQAFLRIGMLCLVQYPMDSTIRLISIVAREAAGFLGVFAIANVVGNLGEWSIYGVCLIFSLGAMTEAISRGLLDNVWSIGSFVRKGKLDIFLIRPASVLFQMLTFRMEFASLVSFFLPCSLMIWSLAKSGVECSISLIAFLIEFLVMGTILNSSLYLIFNPLKFCKLFADVLHIRIHNNFSFINQDNSLTECFYILEIMRSNDKRCLFFLIHLFDKCTYPLF